MSKETRWWWIRHAPVTEHAGKIYGQSDVPADFAGTETSIRGLAATLPMDGGAIVSDPKRAVATADALRDAGAAWAEEHREPAFREQDFGDYRACPTTNLPPFEKVSRTKAGSPLLTNDRRMESYSDVVGRVVLAIIRHTALAAGKDVIAVAHAGAICVAFRMRSAPIRKPASLFIREFILDASRPHRVR